MKIYRLIAAALLVMSTGCTSILVATTDENGLQEDPGLRTAGMIVEDESIETKVTVNMKSMEPQFRDAHFNVISHNGVVLLVGQVQSEALKIRAGEIAAAASNQVRRVHNELEVAGKTTLLSRTNDSWISTKVRTQLTSNKDVPARQIRVITENGAVYLMGMLSQAEGDRAALLARNITGVSKVVKVFEYI
ncbi:MAG: BON domain-containing protein [Gammaproteobacteria bacterium]|nr:BON domain-containing protein [Gammaproteobacteria bacterium]MDP2140196.1 BON domain-containing protein [Gammaproteobacteria bacterium]MDP2348072.1 BON domain-containing protein [Gammaproteobacteria bacterium]